MSAIPVPALLIRYATAVAQPVRSRIDATPGLVGVDARLRAGEAACQRWLIAHSIAILRVSIGAVLLAFGALKFFPGVSPAQGLVEQTMAILTFGMIPGSVALVGVALLETVLGIWLISGRAMRGAVYLLGIQLIGIMSPIVLLPGQLFGGPHGAPTLVGQYVIKDIIIVGAALVLAATLGGGRLSAQRAETSPAHV
jgi:putative oxidoreductase